MYKDLQRTRTVLFIWRSSRRHRLPFIAENGFRFFISFFHLIQFHD